MKLHGILAWKWELSSLSKLSLRNSAGYTAPKKQFLQETPSMNLIKDQSQWEHFYQLSVCPPMQSPVMTHLGLSLQITWAHLRQTMQRRSAVISNKFVPFNQKGKRKLVRRDTSSFSSC